MRKLFKDHINIHPTPDPIERRKNLSKEVLYKGTPSPKPVVYEDIDSAFKEWVETNLDISFDGQRIPTMTLFSNQRFSEYLQTWQYTDENNNVILNFKTVNREKNPQQGSQHEKYYNIPGERYYLMARQIVTDDAGRDFIINYKMKQPMNADLVYTVNIVSNKIELVNEFNMKVLDEFKAKQAYLAPNGYYMSMVLENVSDESKYSVDDRQFYNQSYTVTVRAYIIRPEDIRVEETSLLDAQMYGDDRKKKGPLVSLIEDIPECGSDTADTKYYETLQLDFDICDGEKRVFNTRDNQLTIYFYETENLKWFKMSIDDGEWVTYKPECEDEILISIPENTNVKILIKKARIMGRSKIIFSAFDTNKTNADYNDDGIREFRTEDENTPLEIIDE